MVKLHLLKKIRGDVLKKGEAKIEFFSNLFWLQREFELGLVVSKLLYQKAQKEINLKMTYVQFNKYFNEVFKNTPINAQNRSQLNDKQKNDVTPTPTSKEPLKLKIDTYTKKVFDPLFGKNVKKEDLL